MLKNNFREKSKKLLKEHIKFKFKRDFQVFKECLKIIKKNKAKKILLFIPLKYEPNLFKFRRLLSKNCELFVPFMQDKSLKIVKLRLPLKKKKYEVFEPNDSFFKVKKIDLAIIPVIAVDKNLKRIGHGKGFYDRFFYDLNYKPLTIFVQSVNMFNNKNITDFYDIQGDFYINPYKKYYRKEIINDNNNCSFYNLNRTWIRIFSC
ncbi:5-formyltetrahydrofolate cyclo-ligase [Campylobacter sp. TTU-622]|uniref:5-formyltetrahydrofolate cyclo-ligase n=1 Tax=unclassified Campylobacter TaxID=2593542 RepID=UPI0019067698|nr:MULTISPECIES: 5-formyltetrahydrofolate cyclo-ligase [unclassified Campylobacter]MBK1971609.1 5-formyltetrahydrofolate cyclo-ligase [Campylobacter sp. TTU_617]MBK1973106.1 5-formyltetrahydrofolate cyclo-ligase [Campylobacter sp. TTU-622]